MVTVDHFKIIESCIHNLVTNQICVLSITLLSQARRRLSRSLINMTTTETRFMSDQAQQGQIIRVVLHYAMILLRYFLAHPDHIDNILRMKLEGHHIEMKEH